MTTRELNKLVDETLKLGICINSVYSQTLRVIDGIDDLGDIDVQKVKNYQWTVHVMSELYGRMYGELDMLAKLIKGKRISN